MPKKWKLNQLEQDNVTNYNSNNPAKENSRGGKNGKGGDSLRPQKQQRPPIFCKDLFFSPPVFVLDLDSQCLQVDQQVVSTLWPASPLLQEFTFFHSIKPLHDKASNYTYNKNKDSNSGGIADNQSDISNPEPVVKHYTQTKKAKINTISLDDKWEIINILGERMTKSGHKYIVV